MKNLSFLSCLILLISVNSIAQKVAETKPNEPPRKASKIIVLVRDSANTLFDKLTLALFDKGFTVDNKDERLKLISTKERPMPKGNMLTKIQARINDTAIVFTSTMALGFEMKILDVKMEQTYDPVTYSGMKGSYMRVAWNELDAIARMFGDKIVYSK